MSKNYIHVQPTPSDVWTINHGLGGLPNVDVIIEENGVVQKVLVDRVAFVDENNIEVRFSNPRQGQARVTTVGSLPFPAYDAFTIVEGVMYYPNYPFPELGIYRDFGSTFSSSTWSVCPQSSKLFVLNNSANQLTVYTSMFDLTVEESFPITNYAGSISPAYSTVWNGVFYYCNNGTNASGATQDRTIYWYDTVNQIEGSFNTGVPFQDGIACDGTFLYVSAGQLAVVRKYDLATYSVQEVWNVSNMTNITYDLQQGFFYGVQPDANGASSTLRIYDAFNGSLIQTESLNRANTEFKDLMINGSDVWAIGMGTGGRGSMPLTRVWRNELGIDTSLSTTDVCIPDGTITQYSQRLIVVDPQTGRVVTVSNSLSNHTINIHRSLLDDTLIDTFNTSIQSIEGVPIRGVIWNDMLHLIFVGSGVGSGYWYVRINLAMKQVEVVLFDVGLLVSGESSNIVGMSIYRNELFVVYANNFNVVGVARAPVDVSIPWSLDKTFASGFTFYSCCIDPYTGYIHIATTSGHVVIPFLGAGAPIIPPSPLALSTIQVYGGKLLVHPAFGFLRVEKSLYNNTVC